MSKSFKEIQSDYFKARIFWYLLCDVQDSYIDNGKIMPDSLIKCRVDSGHILSRLCSQYGDMKIDQSL